MTIANTPQPPYFSVIFTSLRTDEDEAYRATAKRMLELAALQPGFLGIESARELEFGITVSYWASLEAIASWKREAEHVAAQRLGREQWYRAYRVRVARVERDYEFQADVDE